MRLTTPMTRAPRRRPADLKTSLLSRIALVAVACFVLVSTVTVFDSERAARSQAATTAELVARHLSFQLLRINAGFDLSNRYPDWGAFLANNPTRGQCVRLDNDKGNLVRSDCIGSSSLNDPPAWFASLWSVISPSADASSPVVYKGKTYGSVVVSSDPKVAAGRAWDELRPLLILTALTIFAVCLLVYMVTARALAPTKDVIGGLNRLQAGEFSHRLPHFKLAELERIAEVANGLAQKIETTLVERAELSRRLINAQEDERRHLARELHDELGQNLAAMSALAASIEKSATDADPETRAEARALAQLAGHTMQSLRGTLQHLRPTDLDKFGLSEGLQHLVDVWNVSQSRKTRFELELPSEMAPLSDTAANHVFRIAQEALTNAAKHADAATVRLRLEAIPSLPKQMPGEIRGGASGIRLTVEDDGVGRAGNGHSASGMGLANIKERVAALGGTFALDERPGNGLRVSVTVPLESDEAQMDGCTT
jgi:two-component system, NarL family, sensor histidine kinase UhpB